MKLYDFRHYEVDPPEMVEDPCGDWVLFEDIPKMCHCWRLHNDHPRGEKPPMTLETLQAAWDKDQELIFEMKKEIAELKQSVNKLRQSKTNC